MRMMLVAIVVVVLAVSMGFAPMTGPSVDKPTVIRVFFAPPPPKPLVCTVIVTAYNSEVGQTDDTPFTTSAQTPTRHGVVAARWLPIGARVRFPGHFDDEVFVVEDRMHYDNWCKVDVWHQEMGDAKEWGIRSVNVEVLEPRGVTCPAQPPDVYYKCPVPVTMADIVAATPVRIAAAP